MEGSKGSGGGGDGAGPEKPSAESNPSLNPPPPTAAAVEATDDGGAAAAAAAAAEAARRPFTALSQEEADLALARVLQEQVSDNEISGPRGLSWGSLPPAINPCLRIGAGAGVHVAPDERGRWRRQRLWEL